MQKVPAIAFVTLGCAKNEVDTDKMQARLAAAGYELIDDLTVADLIIVNTCAFLSAAVEEGLDLIFDISNDLAVLGKNAKILVAGCMPARYGSDLEAELSEASAFISAEDEERIVEKVEQVLEAPAPVQAASLSAHSGSRFIGSPSAYVKISDGCDRFCSYCMIPYIRGRYHSYPLETIEDEVRELISKGAEEIVLIGQDTGIWGHDLERPSTTAELVSALAEEHPHTWFRLLYVQPEGISDELLHTMASHENICSYLDMPLQHADATIIAAMNRKGDARAYLDTIERARRIVPDIMIRTTLIAGFPGETEEQFRALLDFVEEADFDYAAVFPYSPEEGSAAFDFEGQVDEETRLSRAQELLDVCELIGAKRISRLVGEKRMVLAEGYERTDAGLEALCRTQGQAPEVDGQVHVPIQDPADLEPGDFAMVRITDTFYYELEGELVRT